MTSAAVVGAEGYVGKALASALSRKPDITLSRVTRSNYDTMSKASYDILINAAMPSARFWAKNNPSDDFKETVEKTADLFNHWRYGKFVQISTVSARCQLDTVYGKHKSAAEKICGSSDNLIVRLGPMYSPELSKGVLIDMLNGKTLFVAGESRYCFAPLEFSAGWIAEHWDRSGIVEVGARNAVSLREVAEHIGGAIEFEGSLDHQEIVDPEKYFPDARDVFTFLEGRKKHGV